MALLDDAGEDGERLALRAGRRPAGRDAADDPRPAPGAARRRGCTWRSSRCGRTWSRTAATSSCSSLDDGVARLRLEGSCSDCSASSGDARAGDQAGARAGGARPRRARGRGRRPAGAARRDGLPVARAAPAARRRGSTIDRLDLLPAGALAAADVGRRRAGGGQRRRHAAGLPRPLRRLRRAAARRRAGRRRAALPGLRADVLPAPRRPLDGRRPAAARARCRCCATAAPSRWRCRRERERRRNGARRPPDGGRSSRPWPPAGARSWSRACAGWPAARPPPAADAGRTSSAATSAAPTVPDDHRHLLQLVERRIECVCESCWALRSGDAEYRPTGSRTLWLPDIDAARRPLGELPDPDRAGVLHGLDHRRLRGRPLPEPRRRDRERAALRVVEPDGRAEPGAGGARARHRGADRQPPVRPAGLRDRPDRPLLRADRHDQGELGGPLRRLRASRRRSPRSSTPAGRGGRRHEQPPGAPSAERGARARARVRGARRAHRAPRGAADAAARPAGLGAERPRRCT